MSSICLIISASLYLGGTSYRLGSQYHITNTFNVDLIYLIELEIVDKMKSILFCFSFGKCLLR